MKLRNNRKKTTKQFIQDAIAVHGDVYDYSMSEYINSHKKVLIMCPKHGEFWQKACSHTINKRGCPCCGEESRKRKQAVMRKKQKIYFIEKSNEIHNNQYNYSNINYTNNRTKIEILCNIHGIFYQKPNDHLTGYGCPKCGTIKASKSHILSTEEFIARAKNKHGEKYNYSKTKYEGWRKQLIVTCRTHGDFRQTPLNHLKNKSGGCLKCVGLSKTTWDFILQSNILHNNLYEYYNVTYVNAKTKVPIICKKHGVFWQTPTTHLKGSGCTKCCLHQFSNKSILWLDYVMENDNIEIQHAMNSGEFKIPGTKFKADGFCCDTNTIYEFHGDAFHGNLKRYYPTDKCHPFDKTLSAQYLWDRTLKKENIIRNLKYNLIVMWESDWDNLKAKKDELK